LEYENPLNDIIHEFSKMPGIGKRTAQRMSFYLLTLPKDEVAVLANSIAELKDNVRFCKSCFALVSKDDDCSICTDHKRSNNCICVVSDQKDLLAIEGMGRHKGLYHVLGGVISPLDGIGPDSLRIRELLARIDKGSFEEVIFALKPTIEGEATMLYLKKLLSPLELSMSQIAYGIPVGGELEWADEVTLGRAFEGRTKIGE